MPFSEASVHHAEVVDLFRDTSNKMFNHGMDLTARNVPPNQKRTAAK
jgi:hypothetical protein